MAVDPLRGCPDFGEHHLAVHIAQAVLADRFLYCSALGWMEWDGKVWRRHPDREALAVKTAIRYYVAEWIRAEVLRLLPGQLNALVQYTRMAGLDRMERACKTIHGATVQADAFDADPLLINTPEGVLDLLDGTVAPHAPFFMQTRITAGSYRAGASHVAWTKALKALPGDETRRWVQWHLGQGLIGRQRGDLLPFFIGEGGNGKSLLIHAVLGAVGEYGGMLSDELLAGRAHEEQIMRLRALRLGVVEELADGHRLNVSRIKQIIGTERMLGRHLYREPVEWKVSHTLAVTSNHFPIVPETDHGTWRRLLAVPFPTKFKKDERFRELIYTDPAVREAVFAWLVEGAMMAEPDVSKAMQDATELWRVSVDLIAQFLDECCERDESGRVARAALLERFNMYAAEYGHRPLSGRVFAERFKSHATVQAWGVEDTKYGGVRMWRGIGLVAPTLRSVK